jgi:hypothetical protein
VGGRWKAQAVLSVRKWRKRLQFRTAVFDEKEKKRRDAGCPKQLVATFGALLRTDTQTASHVDMGKPVVMRQAKTLPSSCETRSNVVVFT